MALLRALALVLACVSAGAFVPVSRSRLVVTSPRYSSFGAAAASTRVAALAPSAKRREASGLQMNQKKQIFSYVIAAGSALFIANVAESAINDQFNLWPELKKVDSWNYSGSNDAICAKMEIEEPELFKTTKLCTEDNRKAAAEKLAKKQAYLDSIGRKK
eukprot:CAMPEP_0182546968 /NCGR_PEP_ID=MMETSP1323-20130603/36792_1 /TAXON_ID=236787 /ORGANISM="Florenciella parvula, Strain RCC1693" /LENGTH=159 /DNA_ID=CAMNT_0024758233 /DNA_START=13 /DNA_END=492 /DNA_ORIENTATION=-